MSGRRRVSKSGPEGKSFQIPRQLVWEAYRRVKANKGAAGVDGQSMADFEEDLRDNLYRIWNRMSSGTYFPPPVKAVEIPKPNGGGVRILGVPTVADRIAQTVVALRLEARTESIFHPDSYGYRPRKSAHDALRKCRERCWRKDWVLDLDIRKFFDSLDHNLVVRTVEANTADKWVLLYVRRWLKAPLQLPDGTLQERDRGTPQGSAVSPVLANLFLHYAFDMWMARNFPAVPFERYVDDAVVHCVSERQARHVLAEITKRMTQLGLELHPEKTRMVYCQDDKRRGSYEHTEFVFVGYGFRRRSARSKDGAMFLSFLPAISKQALKRISAEVRSWRLHHRTSLNEKDLADWVNPIVRGWMNHYGAFYRSALYPLLRRINAYLLRWVRRKYKRLRGSRKARTAWNRAVQNRPRAFAHWAWVTHASTVW